jgi:hypothetical protein
VPNSAGNFSAVSAETQKSDRPAPPPDNTPPKKP